MTENNFDKVFKENYSNVYHQAYKHLSGDIEAAQDVAQMVFIAYYRSWHKIEGRSKLSVWLYSVCRNECNMHLRRVKGGVRSRTLNADISDIHEIQLKHIVQPIEPISKNLKDNIKLLRDDEKQILTMLVQGYSAEETGNILNLTVPAIKSRIHRIRARLKQLDKIVHKKKEVRELRPIKKKANVINFPDVKVVNTWGSFYKKAANG